MYIQQHTDLHNTICIEFFLHLAQQTGFVRMRNQLLVSIVAGDGLVLKHQAISSHNANSVPTEQQ